jgi:hypothetical protein
MDLELVEGVGNFREMMLEPRVLGMVEYAEASVWVVSTGASVRSEPGGSIIYGLSTGAGVSLLSGSPEVTLNGVTWVRIAFETNTGERRTGWIQKDLLRAVSGGAVQRDRYFVGGLRQGLNVNIRSLPSTSSPSQILSTVTNGAKIRIAWPKETQKEGNTTFVKIHHGNSFAWMSDGSLFPDYPVEYVPPATVSGTHNGASKTLYPKMEWSMVGGGQYAGQALKQNGRYRVAVGPKILRPGSFYPDSGEIKRDEFNGFNKNIRVILERKTTKARKELLCVVDCWKAHTFNMFPSNTGATASFNVESGYVQTGIRYPNATNPSAFSPTNMDGSVIEFCTDSSRMDFNPKDYELIKVIALE